MTSFASGVSPKSVAAAAFRLREFGVLAALAATVLLFAVHTTNFATVGNWQDIAADVAMVVVVAVGETMVILTRNIDLSVGSVVGLTGYLSSYTLVHNQGIPTGIIALLAMAIGLACGVANGILVVVGRVPAIIATLATLTIYRGVVFEVAGGSVINADELPGRFLNLGVQKPLGLPLLAWIAIGIALLGALILRWAPWGRDFYAIGSDPQAARLAGIPVGWRVMATFAISGALAGLGGFFFVARFAGIDVTAGQGFELTVITAVVIGGVNVFGGSGSILGATIGAILVSTINNGFTLLKISYFWLTLVEGVGIVAAVTMNALITRRLQVFQRRRRYVELLAARSHGAEE